MLEEEVVPRVDQAPGFVAGYWTRSRGQPRPVEDGVRVRGPADGAAQFIQSQPGSDAVTIDDVEVREVVANA